MVDTIKFSQMNAGGDLAPGEMTPGLLAGGNVLFNNPWTFLAPGSTASRPVPSPEINGRLRFNTDSLVYEYYDTISATWIELSGSGTGTVNPGAANDLAYYAAAGQIISPIAAAPNSVLITNSLNIPSLSNVFPNGLTIPGATILSSTASLTSGQVATTPVNATDIANKSYVDSSFSAGVTSITGTTNQIIASSPTGHVTLSLPQNIALGSSPQFNNLTLTGGNIFDVNGNIILNLTPNFTSDVNYISISNNISGSSPGFNVLGSDANIGLSIFSKGDAGIGIHTQAVTNVPLIIYSGTISQHQTNFLFANTANAINVTFQDSSGTLAYLSNIPSVVPAALSATPDTNVTITLGGTPATALLEATSITLGWTGTLSGTRGGTGINNGSNTATFSGNLNFANSFSTSGNFSVIQTYTGITNVTFPTSGTLATTSQLPTGAALTEVNDANVTLTLGGSPTNALLNATSLTLGWTGQLSLTRGGTNNSLTASAGGILWSDASKLNILAGTTTANQILLSGNSVTPSWSTTTYPSTNAINTIMYASSTNVLGVISPVNNAVLVSSAGGVPSMSTTLPNMNIGTATAGVLTNTTGGGGLRSFQIFTTGSAATYTKPANVTSILVEIIGGGGGGGGITASATTIAVAGGGGAGGYCRKYISSASGTYTYSVGGGGAGGVGASSGTNGNASSFSTLTANGGTGGDTSTGVIASSTQITQGGPGGTASGGDFNVTGSAGGFGFNITQMTQSGVGAGGIYAGATSSQTSTTANGISGLGYGGGGGGALGGLSASTSQNGGAGSSGIIIVWEFS